jgi:hypothetical protein
MIVFVDVSEVIVHSTVYFGNVIQRPGEAALRVIEKQYLETCSRGGGDWENCRNFI